MDLETAKAKRLLLAQRALQNGDQPLACLCSPFHSKSDDSFTYQEVNQVLNQAVDRDESLGLFKALLALGADVNFSQRSTSGVWSKIIGRHHDGHRSDVLLKATSKCRPDIVNLLAGRADQESLDSVLHTAIVRGDLAVLKTLLDHGANPAQLHSDFQNAVLQNQLDIVQALLSGHRLPCLACRSSGLRLAVANRSLDVTELLLKYWADVNHDDAIALLGGVESCDPVLVKALISGPVRPSPRSLDIAVGRLRDAINSEDPGPAQEVLELCLSAGAAGPETTRLSTEGMVDAVKHGRAQLVDALLRFRKPPGHYEAVALLEAIRGEKIDIFMKLLGSAPSQTSLTIAISETIKVKDTHLRHELARLLIEAGAQGPCTSQALIKVTKRIISDTSHEDKVIRGEDADTKLFNLLLDKGRADVDHGQGEALQLVAGASCTELAELIVSKNPSPASLGAALPRALKIPDENKRRFLVGLLIQDQISDEASGKALVELFQSESRDLNIIELVLKRASVNYNNGEVFAFAIRRFELAHFRLLLGHALEYTTLFTVVLEALQSPRPVRKIVFGEILRQLQPDHLNNALKHVVLEPDTDLGLISVLLGAGADPIYEDGVCIKKAAYDLNRSLLDTLSENLGPNEVIFSEALAGIIGRDRQWIAFGHVETIRLLLRYGASGPAVDKALLEVVEHLACHEPDTDLADTLLNMFVDGGADVNHENGKCAMIAAGRGDPPLLSRILNLGATTMTAAAALSIAITSGHDESRLMQILGAFVDIRHTLPDLTLSLPGMPPPMFLCLKSYCDSASLVEKLISVGCHLESTIPSLVYSREIVSGGEGGAADLEMEPVSVLVWALLQPNNIISSRVIDALIRHGGKFTSFSESDMQLLTRMICIANVSYTTPVSRVTPLLLATRSGRLEVVQSLLQSGAKISARDALGRSALFFAAGRGDADLVALLIKSKACANDGSLHEASRGFYLQAMRLLIESGHDPNYRSTKHEGRTALGEMARMATIDDITVAEEALDILCAADASPLLTVHGKTVIFLALDNQNNEPMTRMLLDRVLYRTLNSQENIFQQGVYWFSPTMYVCKGILLGPQSRDLVQVLRDHGAEDRFYASLEETQPPDAVGLPEEILEFERERRARDRQIKQQEEEHTNELRREMEKAQNVGHIREELTQQQLRHRGLEHKQLITMDMEKHYNNAHIKISEADVDSGVRWLRHNDDLSMTSEKRAADMEFRQRAYQQNVAEVAESERLAHVIRDHRHHQTMQHRQGSHRQRWAEKEDLNRQQLAFEGRRQGQDFAHARGKNQLKRELMYEEDRMAAERQMREKLHGHQRHQMHMTELTTQRGNIIGQVNLEELRRWQASQGQGQAPSHIGGGPQGPQLQGARARLLN
ncbi:hypothetical protein B0T26DRAFT_822245 [Lasiosphaeria miniovina]|uniref:Uncharacterized protein n=1 Tax=Lasiosphaeria miniovina TaxID=1954250 RepID=A0AA40B509_9PEZI|nr:uncharacterized protein B0T26DRAFT_822245 [Lasiosphaeria miniovina]KAK0727667.1 hypothetical protein B0T26DRAFT_822245 [Lasiosphaeria miniovina]